MPDTASTSRFYDELADDYHLIYADWEVSLRRQGAALDALIGRERAAVLDCACGIGTQALGLALRGHRVVGTDVSARAVARAGREAGRLGAELATAVADMRQLPFPADRFDAVVCADNALPHLLTERAALAEMRRVLRPGGRLLVSTRAYDDLLRERPASTPPQVHAAADGTGRSVSFQLWHWREDGEHYDLEHFQLRPARGEGRGPGEWRVRVRPASYWALGRDRLAGFAAAEGFADIVWLMPEQTGFFQPLLAARAVAAD
ncbi:class I SAM-dependent methyltransferase [Streptomyces monashensis]|uniref:class I SAM-dependent methyltransferase n=1 Tax=Streptomyces monashensis TaxID=1678012 RepID=UPI0033C3A857